jgi:hypothetical protein
VEKELVGWLASVADNPLAFVMGAFPWGVENSRLEHESGPEEWQRTILELIRTGLPIDQAIQLAVASGHGVGKTALVAWIILWGLTTMSDTKGVVTANTETQLKTKTWAELGKWFHMFVGKEYFKLTATAIFQPDRERTWRIDMVPWSERNTEAFAGLHNKGKRIILLMDEGSAIPNVIYEVSEGALTDADTQIIWCVFGNPTRNTGRFRECFPGQQHSKHWKTYQVDSRTVRFTNKDQIQRWVDAYGEDSDFVRVRVRGVFPRIGEMEFISLDIVSEACAREPSSNQSDPFVIGVDVARYGDNETVIYFRKGRDGQSTPPIRLRGADVVQVATKVAEAYRKYHADAIFVDGGGVGGGVIDNLRNLHVPCFDIQFGSRPQGTGFAVGDDGVKYANKRAEIWGSMKEWLKFGAIPNNQDLRAQLVGPTYTFNLKNEIQLEKKEDMRKRGLESPDLADALALTFSLPVTAHASAGGYGPEKPMVETEYNPFAPERMVA